MATFYQSMKNLRKRCRKNDEIANGEIDLSRILSNLSFQGRFALLHKLDKGEEVWINIELEKPMEQYGNVLHIAIKKGLGITYAKAFLRTYGMRGTVMAETPTTKDYTEGRYIAPLFFESKEAEKSFEWFVLQR